jgi:hypothetical protein
MERGRNDSAGGANAEPATIGSALQGPPIYPPFVKALDELVALAREGQRPDSEFFNPGDDWLVDRMRILPHLPKEEQQRILKEHEEIGRDADRLNAEGKAARRAGADAVSRTDVGGLAFFSQLGVARRPDLTQYFIDGFLANRDGVAFSDDNQKLFAEVLPEITVRLRQRFDRGDTVIQSDRRICDAPGRSFHARQLVVGTRYLQLPYFWRQLTFGLPEGERQRTPDIIELSIPRWLEDLSLPPKLVARIRDAGIEQLVFKAPTKGLSLHLGFDYVGEHKMGPLTIAMFMVKQRNGLAVQAALSMSRITTLTGRANNTAVVTIGPSLHGKSTLTIMIDPRNSDLAERLGLQPEPDEGVYPMNDDIVLLQPLAEAMDVGRDCQRKRIVYAIDGTEDNFYAVPFGLTRDDDPITYDVLRGTEKDPNRRESLENVRVDPESGAPDFLVNPTRNMRAIFSRSRLIERKSVQGLLERITGGRLKEGVHIPLEDTDRVLWQAVMRQNTVVPPLRRFNREQYVRTLMFGEAVQMGAASGAIGRPYVEYFSDPFIIGLEDENANLMHHILREMERQGQRHEYYAFNTGGIGAESNEAASGPGYKKIPRELTLMLQEAVLREAISFEYDGVRASEVAVAIVDTRGREILDLRKDWLPQSVYGEDEYGRRVTELTRRRYYGRDSQDKAGILRYTKVSDALIDISDVPVPTNEREVAWLLSFCWHVDAAYGTLSELAERRHEGMRPAPHVLRALQAAYEKALAQGLDLPSESRGALGILGLADRR